MSLQIKVISALLTRDTQTFSNMDPYTIVQIGSDKRKTRTHQQGGKKPQWNDVFTFQNLKGNMIKFTVMDEDVVTDDLVGQGALNLDKFMKNPTEQAQYISLTYKGKASGKLYVSILYNNGNNKPIYQPGNQTNNNINVNPYNNNQGFGQNQNNQGWGNNQSQGWGVQNNQGGLGQQNTGWGNTQNTGWGSNQNIQGLGTQNTQNTGWGTQNTQSTGWGNNQNTQGWGNNQNKPVVNNQNNINNPLYPDLNIQSNGNNVNQQIGQQFLNKIINPNTQQNQPQQQNVNQNTNVLDVLNVALKNGINQPPPPQNSGWNNQPANNGWGVNQPTLNNNQSASNSGWGTNPYQTNPKGNGW